MITDEEQTLIAEGSEDCPRRNPLRVDLISQSEGNTKNVFLQSLISYAPLTIFGFCAILLDVVFEAPGAINCISVLDQADWKNASEITISSLRGVRNHYNLIVAYAIIKGVCIALQV